MVLAQWEHPLLAGHSLPDPHLMQSQEGKSGHYHPEWWGYSAQSTVIKDKRSSLTWQMFAYNVGSFCGTGHR